MALLNQVNSSCRSEISTEETFTAHFVLCLYSFHSRTQLLHILSLPSPSWSLSSQLLCALVLSVNGVAPKSSANRAERSCLDTRTPIPPRTFTKMPLCRMRTPRYAGIESGDMYMVGRRHLSGLGRGIMIWRTFVSSPAAFVMMIAEYCS